jgi:uncharacterized protein (DUF1800 family)
MFRLMSRTILRLVGASVLVLLSLVVVPAQGDPDPNSPTPILISENDSTRALTQLPDTRKRGSLSRSLSRVFWPDSKIELFVTNIDLMAGEGANAFRVYAQDSKSREYRFPVYEISEVREQPGVFRIVTRLTDELHYFPAPEANGDILIRLSWRGLSSNRVRLALGSTGGDIKDDAGAVPTPLSIAGTKQVNDGQTNELVGYTWSGDRIRFLEQATFGPTQALDQRLRRIGLRTWLAEQFDAPYPSSAYPYPNIPLMNTNPNADPVNFGCGVNDGSQTYTICIRDHYTMYPVQTWFYKSAFYGEPQLRDRIAWTLSQIWVISGLDTQQSSHMLEYHKQLSKNAFGNYRTLMYDMTLNPGMGNYLDMMRSTRANPNENYPREILQLFTIGLFMLNQDGTVQVDGQGNPIPTYDQNVVNNFTKVFTGWRDCRPADFNASCPDFVNGTQDYKDPMSLNALNQNAGHDLTAKTLFNYPGAPNPTIPACVGCTLNTQIYPYATSSLNQALDNIYNHPNVGPFVSKLLIQHLVTSDPTPAYVGRVAAVFNANRTNPTQMKEVVKAILLDPEARGDLKTDPRYGKLREPVQLMTNLYRHFNVSDAAGTGLSDGDVNRLPTGLAQNTFNPPTVFNYYPPNFIVPGTTLLAPEFGIFTTGTAIGRANLGNSIVFGQINVSMPNTPSGTKINFADLQAIAAADPTSSQLLDHLNTRMMHGAMSAQMKQTIMTAVNTITATDTLGRARAAVYLIVTSSQYQVQR